MRILVVEDEMMVALMLEDMLRELGHEVVGTATRLSEALDWAATGELDLAILDINLDGLTSFPVAEILTRRGVPFLFATGYGGAGLEPPYENRVVVRKPFLTRDIESAIKKAA